MSSPPPGVETFTGDEEQSDQLVIAVSGGPKTGKSTLATNVQRPLYVCFLDPHDNLDRLLRESAAQYPGPVHVKRIRPMRYTALTEDKAQKILDEIEEFAAWARTEARTAKANGEPTGTFVLDGGKRFKGYIEKAKLGESITLGWRPAKGGGSISRYEYAEANTYIIDFLAAFLGNPLDVVITFEGQRKYIGNDRTEDWRSGVPDGIGYVAHAEVVTFIEKTPIVVESKVVGQTNNPKLRIVYNDAMPAFNDRAFKGQTLDGLKELFGMKNEPQKAEALFDPTEEAVEPDPFAV